MRGKTSWILVAVLVIVAFGFQPAPAQAQFPEGWSMLFFDVTGFLMECVDFSQDGTAYAYLYADKAGSCTTVDEFEPGRTRLECVWRNVDWSFFAPNTKRFDLDVTCTRWGGVYYFVGSPGPASCAAGASYKRVDQYGANFTANEGYSAATIGSRRKCSSIFGPAAKHSEVYEARDLVRMRRR